MEELITFIDDNIALYERILNRVTKTQQDSFDSNNYIRTINNYILIDKINSILVELNSIRTFAKTIKNAKNS